MHAHEDLNWIPTTDPGEVYHHLRHSAGPRARISNKTYTGTVSVSSRAGAAALSDGPATHTGTASPTLTDTASRSLPRSATAPLLCTPTLILQGGQVSATDTHHITSRALLSDPRGPGGLFWASARAQPATHPPTRPPIHHSPPPRPVPDTHSHIQALDGETPMGSTSEEGRHAIRVIVDPFTPE